MQQLQQSSFILSYILLFICSDELRLNLQTFSSTYPDFDTELNRHTT
jgi:hypothetical protein